MIYKNTYGISTGFSVREFGVVPKNEFSGSALQRKKLTPEDKKRRKTTPKKTAEPKPRSMSTRTKRKISKKLMCFARCYKRLNFVTLTFLNKVDDAKAVNVLRKFLDNVKKRSKNFQYLWVIERQTQNEAFIGNVHFHMITNKYWDIEKWWNYWLDLQQKNGILPREKDFRPTSAFDVKQITANNVRTVKSYITKYVTKNMDKFNCQVWNCSRQVSELYTDFYTDKDYVEEFKKINAVHKEFEVKNTRNIPIVNVKIISLNRQTLPLYKRLDEKNKAIT